MEKEKQVIFPWGDVNECMNDKIEPLAGHLPCPICGMPSEKLLWIHFDSPAWTWEKLCGRAGKLSICSDCHSQVEFICTEMC